MRCALHTGMMKRTAFDDTDLLSTVAVHPDLGQLQYEKAGQDRRTYYRLTVVDNEGKRIATGSITDAKHACASVVYWREKGWAK